MKQRQVEAGHAPADDHALVIGGGMAGLLAARVLSDHFDRVTVVERDVWPDTPIPRAGAPRGRHVHALLARGYRLLRRWFPELDADLDAASVPKVDWLADAPTLGFDGWAPRFRSRVRTRICSRPPA